MIKPALVLFSRIWNALFSWENSKETRRAKRKQLCLERLSERAVLASFYINPASGNDTADGLTEQTAWKSGVNIGTRYEGADLAPHAHSLQPGDVVNFIEGSHSAKPYFSGKDFGYQFLFLRGIHGTAEKPITIRGIDLPSITSLSPNGTEMFMIYALQSSHIHISGIELSGGYGSAITIAESNHISIEDMSIRDVDGVDGSNLSGVHVVASSNVKIAGNSIIDVYDRHHPGNLNNRPIVVFGSTNVSVLNNSLGYSELGLGFGVEYKHLGSLSAEQAGMGQFLVSGNVVFNASDFGISSAAPNSLIQNNLLIDCNIRLADIGGTAQLSNERVINNTIVNSKQNARTGSLYYAPTEYAGYPLGIVEFLNNLIYDQREYLTGEVNTLEVNRYGSDENYRKSIGSGLLRVDRNVYSTRETPRFDIFGADNRYNSVGGVFSFAEWQSQGYDRQGALTNLSLDEFFTPNMDVAAGWNKGSSFGLTILPASRTLSEDGKQKVRITRRGTDLSMPLIVTLSSSAEDRVSVPSTVTIPSGRASIDFDVMGIRNHSAGDERAVQIKAIFEGAIASTWFNMVDAPPPVDSSFGIFEIPGSGTMSIRSKLALQNGEYRSELGIAVVDDKMGTVNGRLPSSKGWLAELLSTDRSKTIFAAGSEVGETTEIELQSGSYAVFYLVQNATLDKWRSTNPDNLRDQTPVVFVSTPEANPDGFDHVREVVGESWTLAWEDLIGGGDRTFTDVVAELEFMPKSCDALVNYNFDFSDREGNPINTIAVGDQFFVDVFAVDNRVNPLGVFSAALDVEFSASLAQAMEPIVYGPAFPNFHTGRILVDQMDELGAGSSILGASSGSLVARLPMRAKAPGRFVVTGNSADDPLHQTTLIGIDTPLSASSIAFGEKELIIVTDRHWHNSERPEDVNEDGSVSPIDALNIINHLNSFGASSDLYSSSVDAMFAGKRLDVNDDGFLTPLDALIVINWLNDFTQTGR